ncbi:MAG: hypothetical protein A2Z14_07805 [Chloroflexi bacterium RBG_16_48_8]|nr:MAG: hypothetical protein A2Z14_07805 [Chloroflexi bacterium RBG_16_48_8]
MTAWELGWVHYRHRVLYSLLLVLHWLVVELGWNHARALRPIHFAQNREPYDPLGTAPDWVLYLSRTREVVQ